MKKSLYLSVILFVFTCVSCKPKQESEIVPTDGLRHDTMIICDTLFNNPERGFHRYFDLHSPNPTQFSAARINGIYEGGNTLLLTNYFLEAYKDTLIADSYLEVVRNNLQSIREGGCKCIIRFAYSNSEKEYPHDAPEELVLQHIAQIKPILQEYADVIFTMEAGFVGVWGEWHYTTYYPSGDTLRNDSDYISRRHILDALLDAMPKERMICVRTPKFKMKCYGLEIGDTLTRAEAYSGTPKARLACHDDAFMADHNDLGTFNTATQRQYWAAETKYLIYGGESCPPGTAASCDQTTNQMMDMHISYLNSEYYKPTLNKWHKYGCMDNFKLYMGYRIEGREVTSTYKPKAGEELKVKLSLVNVGYSAPKNPRDIEMLLINEADDKDVYRVVPDCDPRFWFTDEMNYVEASFRPKKAGSYKLYLNLPDPQPTLHDNPRYSIRLANENCWDAKTGYNYLTTINVE